MAKVIDETSKVLQLEDILPSSQNATSQVKEQVDHPTREVQRHCSFDDLIKISCKLCEESPDIIQALVITLKEKAKRISYSRVEDTNETAYQHFALEQLRLTTREILLCCCSKRITAVETKELIENMIALIDYLLGENEPHAAKSLSNNLCELIEDITPIMERLEKESNAGVTKWAEVRKALQLPDASIVLTVPDLQMVDLTHRKLLGYGGMGVVFRIKFAGQSVAMKMGRYNCSNESIARAAIAGSLLRHPLIVRQIASFPTSNCQLTLSEFIDGANLHMVANRKHLSDNVVKILSAQLCLAVSYLHKMGIIHRDIKPSNVLVVKHGRIKLIDFDFVKFSIGKFVLNRKIATFENRRFCEFADNEKTGTKEYAPPELTNSKVYGRTVDWFLVGRTVHKIYTSCVPYNIKSLVIHPRKFEGHISNFVELLTNPIPSKRLANIHEICKHPFFDGVNWSDCEAGRVICDELNSAISLPHYGVNKHLNKEKLRALIPEDMKVKNLKTSVYKVFSSGYHKAVNLIKDNQQVTLEDLYPEYDLREDLDYVPPLLGKPEPFKNIIKAQIVKKS